MSPTPEDLERLDDPNVGNLGEDPEAFERRRLAQRAADRNAAVLNEADDRPLRENFGPHEGGSWDTPDATHDAIAAMKAARAPSRVHAAGLGPAPPTRRLIASPPPAASPPPLANLATASITPAELQIVIRDVIAQVGMGLAQKFEDLRQDLEENTRLLGVMNAPMEAIADSHERATSSFETLRRDIASGMAASPALDTLTKALDTAGLTAAQSKAELRFEQLAEAIVEALTEARKDVKEALAGCAHNMLQVLHLLERLQARELREAKRRAMAP